MSDAEEEEFSEEEAAAAVEEDESEDLYESDVSLAEEVDEQEAQRPPAAPASVRAASGDDDDVAGWEARAARGAEARVASGFDESDEEEEEESEHEEEVSYGDEDEELGEDEEDDAALAAQGLRRRQQAGALTARQRALQEPAAAVGAPYSPGEAAARPTKRKLQDDGPDAALRREAAKARVRLLKEQQLKEAREAATAKILSGDTSRKRQAAKAHKEHEERLAERRAHHHPQPGFVRIKRGPAGSVLEFAPGERPYFCKHAAEAAAECA